MSRLAVQHMLKCSEHVERSTGYIFSGHYDKVPRIVIEQGGTARMSKGAGGLYHNGKSMGVQCQLQFPG